MWFEFFFSFLSCFSFSVQDAKLNQIFIPSTNIIVLIFAFVKRFQLEQEHEIALIEVKEKGYE